MRTKNHEYVKDVLYRDDKIIVHIGKDGFDATRFFMFTKETAKEVVDVLNKFIGGNNEHQ